MIHLYLAAIAALLSVMLVTPVARTIFNSSEYLAAWIALYAVFACACAFALARHITKRTKERNPNEYH